MKFDLESLSLKELQDLQAQVSKTIASYNERKKQKALAAIEEQARAHGFSLNELVASMSVRKRKPARQKYVNPANSEETWTGRGRKPRWVEAMLKSGKSLDDLLI